MKTKLLYILFIVILIYCAVAQAWADMYWKLKHTLPDALKAFTKWWWKLIT